jgi:hypothetical protein
MEILVLAIVIGLIPAKIAHDKGHNFWQWWAFGALLWIVATPMAILLKPMSDEEREAWQAGKITPGTLRDTLRPSWWDQNKGA